MRAALVSIAALAFGLTGLIGFAHTKAGRPLRPLLFFMNRHTASGACPFGYDKAPTGAGRDAARAAFAEAHRGTQRAAARPALGFQLDRTTRDDVAAWAAAHRVSCRQGRGMSDLECEAVPAGLLPGAVAAQALWMTFGADGTLKSVTAVRRDAAAARIRGELADRVQAVSGACAAKSLTGDPGALEQGALRQASAEFRCADYYALTRATNMGDGFLLTEEYRAL